MANAIGPATWMRCAQHLAQPGTQVYELSHLRSNDMPMSPWAPPLEMEYQATNGVPGHLDVWHAGARISGEPAAQGTQMDAFAHWGSLAEPWDGEGEFPVDEVTYYGGFTQAEVKPAPDAPLAKLGIDKAPPIVTSAVLLDAKKHMGGNKVLSAGTQIQPTDMEAMLEAQGLASRGILPGDVLYIRTGWGENWGADHYYEGGPGLSYESAVYLAEKGIVLVALDNPFTDAVSLGQYSRGAPAPPGAPPNVLTPVHYYNLTQAGVHQVQNANLTAIADDQVWLSCTMILPLRVEGGTGSPVRPVAIGVPAM
jgi:kynurenine formamidase